MQITALEATDQGGDMLLVRATVDELPGVWEARGWVSATEQHYADAPGPDGHRPKGARPRAMNAAECRAYYLQLLAEQNPELAALHPRRQPSERRLLHQEHPEVLAEAEAAGGAFADPATPEAEAVPGEAGHRG